MFFFQAVAQIWPFCGFFGLFECKVKFTDGRAFTGKIFQMVNFGTKYLRKYDRSRHAFFIILLQVPQRKITGQLPAFACRGINFSKKYDYEGAYIFYIRFRGHIHFTFDLVGA